MLTKIKGTQDFLDLTLFNFLLATTQKQLALYNFHEIATPLIEPTALFHRSLGLQTDVVSKEMYYATTAHATDAAESICLRPEATASTMRAFVNAHTAQPGTLNIPWKVFSWGPMFRHERPQKGRYRQFHQINIEVIGADAIAQDAQLITLLDRLFSEKLLLSSYALLVNFMGCATDRTAFTTVLHDFLTAHQAELCANCTERKEKNILRVFDCKNESCQALYATGPAITDHLCAACAAEWQTLTELLQQLSVSFSHKPTLVRGFDYYSKTVFEFVSINLGAQNTFCGGGRYNSLATDMGAKHDYPSIGAAIGIERVLLLLEQIPQLPLPHKPALTVILPFGIEQQALCLQLADTLHAHGIVAELLLEQQSLKNMLRKADKLGARYCVLVGPDEQASGVVTVKDMVNATEKKVAQIDLVAELR